MRYRNEVLIENRLMTRKRRSKQTFLSSFRQYANAEIATTTCHQDTIVIQITKELEVTEKKKLTTFLKSASQN